MQARTVERIEEWGTRPFSGGVEGLREWGTRPFSGGVEGLRDLADSGFSGAVDAGPWVFVLNGRVVGVLEGALEDAGPGTAYVAPHDSLPLLFVMLERGGEQRGRYYTGETPLAEVDETLREGGFTGYIELSENVLSGDYYLVYHGGQRRACAFVGQAERLYTGDEAYERAADEVGIYTVTAVDVGVVDLPGTDSRSGGVAGTGTGAGAGVGGEDARSPSAPGASGDGPEPRGESDRATGSRQRADSDTDSGDGVDAAGGSPRRAGADSGTTPRPSETDTSGSATDGHTGGARDRPSGRDGPSPSPSPDPLGDIEAAGTPSEPDDAPASSPGEEPGPASEPDPEPAPGPASADLRPAVRSVDGSAPPSTAGAADDTPSGGATESGRAPAGEAASGPAPGDAGAAADRIETLRAERAELDEENDRLREELAAERERVADLQSQVRRLEERVRDLQSDEGTGTERTLSLGPEEALSGTSLFVRYGDKGTATLADALAGESEREAVRENLTLEHHTTFDDGAAAVDGEPFEAFLEDSMAFGVASWLVRELPYEIRDTGHVDDLGALYEAIPEIDRIELRGSVDAGEESVGFDVVCRDRMGTPLIVVGLHDSREPAGAGEMEELLESAGRVAEATETLAGAILVTASFFDPPALETAEGATAGGGLIGSGPTSFVRLSRRVGYHLCLVEARDGRFHVAMPEL